MHVDRFVRGKGNFMITAYVPTDEKSTRKYPLLLTTGRILSQYNVGAQTRRTGNVAWHDKDVLEIHEADAELRGADALVEAGQAADVQTQLQRNGSERLVITGDEMRKFIDQDVAKWKKVVEFAGIQNQN